MKKFFENKMTRRAAKIAALFFAASLALFSCDNFSSSDFSSGGGTGAVPDASKAYVKIAGVQTKETAGTSKTVLPNPLTVDDFTDWTLKREVPNEGPVAIASADSLAELTAYAIEVQNPDPERDYFILEAKKGTVTFSSSASARLTPGVAAELSFTLMPTSGDGSFLVKVNFTGNAAAADWTLSTAAGAAQSGEAEFTKTASGGTAVAKADVNVLGPEYPTYTLDINFYGDEAKTIPLNTYSELVRIVPGYQSGAERDIDLNALYKITYHNLPESYTIEGGGTLPLNYSRKSGDASGVIQISNVAASGKYFAGWYTSADFAPTSRASQILPTTASDVDLYGLFTDELYVSNSGSSSAVGTKDDPLGSIADAASIIQSAADSTINWKIMIDGILTGPQSLEELSGGAGMAAASITLKGVKGPSGGVFQDGINAGWDGTTVPETTIGSALKIKIPTSIPITIHDLYVKGGYATSGGGLYIDTGYVTFENGMITANKATATGGGVFICNSGFATLVMTGGSIAANQAGTNGGGVYINIRPGSPGERAQGAFVMSAGSVSGNTAGGLGKGVYLPPPAVVKYGVRPSFGMSGSAVVASDNDVYLAVDSGTNEESVITIFGALTGATPVATITGVANESGAGYKNTLVLTAEGGDYVPSYCKKFAVTPDAEGTAWYVDSDGTLTNVEPVGDPNSTDPINFYVASASADPAGNDGTGDGSEERPFASIYYAAGVMRSQLAKRTNEAANNTDCTIKVSGMLGQQGDANASQDIGDFNNPFEFSKLPKSLVIEGVNGSDADGIGTSDNNIPALAINTNAIVTLKNLKIIGPEDGDAFVIGASDASSSTTVVFEDGAKVTGCADPSSRSVYINCKSKFIMRGGEITGNAGCGVSVCSDSGTDAASFEVSGNALVSSDNPVCLAQNAKIVIDGPLSQSSVATIYPQIYPAETDNIYVLEVKAGSGTTLADEYRKFAVVPFQKPALIGQAPETINYIVNEYGMLEVATGGITYNLDKPDEVTKGCVLKFTVTAKDGSPIPASDMTLTVMDSWGYVMEPTYTNIDPPTTRINYVLASSENEISITLRDGFSANQTYTFKLTVSYDGMSYSKQFSVDVEQKNINAQINLSAITDASDLDDLIAAELQDAASAGSVKLKFNGDCSLEGVNLYSTVGAALSGARVDELDFSECTGTSLESVPSGVFGSAYAGKKIALSSSTTKIAAHAFASIGNFDLLNTSHVEEIGEQAFYDNTRYNQAIGDIDLSSVTKIEANAFGDCYIGKLTMWQSASADVSTDAFQNVPGSTGSSVTASSAVIYTLDVGKFEGSISTYFGTSSGTTNYCKITYFEVDSTNAKYKASDDKELLTIKNADGSYSIYKTGGVGYRYGVDFAGSGITEVDDYFKGYGYLKTVKLAGVERVLKNAFNGDGSSETAIAAKVTISNSLKFIGNNAFNFWTSSSRPRSVVFEDGADSGWYKLTVSSAVTIDGTEYADADELGLAWAKGQITFDQIPADNKTACSGSDLNTSVFTEVLIRP